VISVPYRDGERVFEFQYKPIMPWIAELARDPSLAHLIMWDAVKEFKCNGASETRIIGEPNTADSWWEAQVRAWAGISATS
jgi:hypothetical protein